MSVIHVSEWQQRDGLRSGQFDQACERCSAAHAQYGLCWAVCDSCSETVCDDCVQPGTTHAEDCADGTQTIVGTCRRCVEQAQEALTNG